MLDAKRVNYIRFGVPIYLICYVILACIMSSNFEFRKVQKDDLVQYQFAKIINEKPNATLLNYGFLDGGFYTVTGIMPDFKYFQNQNIDYENYPIIMNEQNRYIKEALADFVILKLLNEDESFNVPCLYENYKKIDTKYVESVNCYYMLFEKIEK